MTHKFEINLTNNYKLNYEVKYEIMFSWTSWILEIYTSMAFTLSDKISADESAENLSCCRKFCPPKILSDKVPVRL